MPIEITKSNCAPLCAREADGRSAPEGLHTAEAEPEAPDRGPTSTAVADEFMEHREWLFGIAYRMLGSVAEAEDAVQEAYVRWQRQDAATVEEPRAWLVAAITRWCIDQLRSARRRREDYVGVWLPEPLVDPVTAAPDEAAAKADSLSMAFLLMLETLEPVERAVFLLREAFEYDYAVIAAVVEKSEANCRQIFSRARARLRGRGEPRTPATPQAEAIVQRFMTACLSGNLRELLAVLTDDAVLYADGGGRVRSVLRPILSADRISRFYLGIRARALVGGAVTLVRVNGEVGACLRQRNGNMSVMAFALDGERIRAIYAVNNPEKLQRLRPWTKGSAGPSR
jgi:RNA polymerase sigma-70 factor (ECF subfamily)